MLVHILHEADVHVEDVDGGVGLDLRDVVPQLFDSQPAEVHFV